jgi:hypothetical protein
VSTTKLGLTAIQQVLSGAIQLTKNNFDSILSILNSLFYKEKIISLF